MFLSLLTLGGSDSASRSQPEALSASSFYVGTAAHDADDRIIYDQVSGALYYDADGDGAAVAVRFATLTTKPNLTEADFLVV